MRPLLNLRIIWRENLFYVQMLRSGLIEGLVCLLLIIICTICYHLPTVQESIPLVNLLFLPSFDENI
jgi:tryptophan-rich sensory protein